MNGLHHYIQHTLNNRKAPCLIVNGTNNHIHALFSLHPDLALSTLIKEVKRASNTFLKHLDTSYYQNFQWQRGYAAFSISGTVRNQVFNYIRNQEEHHKTVSIREEFERLIARCHTEGYIANYYWEQDE